MDDLIDFSDRDDEFLSSDIKQRAASFAIVTCVVGFLFSAWIFLGKGVGPASTLLDRQAAEGADVTQSHRRPAGEQESFANFKAPKLGALKTLTPRSRPTWQDLADAQSLEIVQESISRPKKSQRVVETSFGVIPDYKRTKASPQRAPVVEPKKSQTITESLPLERLLFPLNENRSQKSTLDEVEAALRSNLIVLETLNGDYEIGLGIDPSGLALISSRVAAEQRVNRVWAQGQYKTARVVRSDEEFGLSLIKVSDIEFKAIPLSPAPPRPGELLVSFVGQGRGARAIRTRAGLAFGKAGVFLGKGLRSQKLGTCLVNERGELVACHTLSLNGTPGNGIHLGADSSAIYRLLRGYQNSTGSTQDFEAQALLTLTDVLQMTSSKDQSQRGRILPGQSLSDFYLGMPQAEAARFVSTPKKYAYSSQLERWDSPAPPVSLYFVNERLALASTQHNGFSTPDGLSVGAEANLRMLSKSYEYIDVYPGLLSCPGLEIEIDEGSRIETFVAVPEILSP